jgi:hypothetical protein
MANTIKLNHNANSGKSPTDLAAGEIAINSANKKIWVGTDDTTAGQVLLFDHSIYSTDLSDNDTTYTAGSGLSLSGTVFSHSDTSSQGSIDGTGRQYIQDVTLDTYGHVTGLGVATETVTNTNTTYSAGSGLNLSGTTFSHSDTSSQGSINLSGRQYIQDLTLDTYGHVTGYGYGTETVTDSDTNTTYSAGTGLSLSGTTFSVDSNVLRKTTYYNANTWMQFSGQYGLYWNSGVGAQWHIYPVNTTTMLFQTANSSAKTCLQFRGGATTYGSIEFEDDGKFILRDEANNERLGIPTSGSFVRDNTHIVWDSGNVTAGTGISISGNTITNTVTNTNTTYTAGTGLSLSGTTFNMTAAGVGVRGGVKLGYPESGQFYPVEAHGTSERLYVNVPWQNTTYVVQDGGLTQKNFTTTLKNKLDGITGYNYSAGTGLTLSGSTFSLTNPSVLASAGNYVWSASTTAGNYTKGLQCSFVRSADGWPEYGSVLHVGARGGSDAGGDFQIYCGHGSGNGGNYLRVRNADNSASPTDSWTSWRTIWDSGNVSGGGGITVSGTTVSHTDTSSQGSINLSGRQYIQDLTLDTYGHVTGYGYATETVTNTDTNTTYSAGNGLTLSGTTFKTDRKGTFVEEESATNKAAGWYTIAINSGNRAIGRFGLRDTASSRHQAVIFYAAHHFGTDGSNSITVLHNSYYGTSPFRYIRIKDGGTYDGAALQVYLDDNTNNIVVYLLGDNIQDSSWYLRDWIADGTDPTGVSNYSSMTEKSKIDLDQIAQGGIATTGPIYGFGDTTQYQLATQSWVNSQGFSTTTGDITGVTAGAGLTGGGTSGSITIAHNDTSSQGSINLSGRQYIQDLTLDTYGHVTGYGYATETVTNTDTNTTYSAGSGLSLSGTTFSHTDTSSQGSINLSGRQYIQDLTLDTYGHVTGYGYATETVTNTDTNTTYSAGTALTLSGTTFSLTNSTQYLKKLSAGSAANLDTYTDNGFRSVSHTGHSKLLLSMNAGGSTGTFQLENHYNGQCRVRNKVDSNNWADWEYLVSTTTGQTAISGTILHTGNLTAGGGLTRSSTTISHSDTSSQGSINLSGRQYIQDLTLDTYGHVTGYGYATETVTNTDTNTTYSAGSGLSLSGTTFSHTDTSSQGSINLSGRQYIQDLTLDTYGHVTGYGYATETVTNTDTNTTYSAGSMLNLSGTTFSLAVTSRPVWSANNQNNWDTIATASSSQGCLEIYNNGAGNDAFMAFHCGGDYAIYFGLDADNNKLSVGGWSMGANKYQIYHSGNPSPNTTYSAGSGISLSGTTFSHADTSSSTSANNSGRTYVQDITLDTYGHVTALSSATETVTNTDTNTTYSAGAGLALSGTTFSHSQGAGQNHIPAGGASNQFVQYSGASGQGQWATVQWNDLEDINSLTALP